LGEEVAANVLFKPRKTRLRIAGVHCPRDGEHDTSGLFVRYACIYQLCFLGRKPFQSLPRFTDLGTRSDDTSSINRHTMPVPSGFSVGDCISICLLIEDAIKAPGSVHGSKPEYQAVIRELGALDRALLEVVSLQESVVYGHTKQLVASGVTGLWRGAKGV
jgi:hypothetical protein